MALYKAAFLPSTPSSLSPPSCSLCCRISRPALSLPLPPASLRSSLSLHASMFVHPPSLSLRLLPRTFRKSLSMNTRKMPFCSSSASNIPSSSSSSSLSSPNLSPPPKQRALFVTAVSAAGALFLGSLLSASAAMAAQPVVLQQLSAGMADVLPTLSKLALVLRTQGPLLVALLALSAFFSLAETSITTLWPWKVRELAEKEVDGGLFQLLRQDVTRFLTTILIGTTVVNIGATALVTEAATTIFGEAGVTAATGFMTVLLLLFTEIAPKSIAVHNATSVARVVVRPVAWLSIILYPLGRFCTAISMWLLKLLGLKSSGYALKF